MFDQKYDIRKILEPSKIQSASDEINTILNKMSEALQVLYTKEYKEAADLFEQQAIELESLANKDDASQYIFSCCHLFKWISNRFRFEKELAVGDELKNLLKENKINLYFIMNQFSKGDLKQNPLTANIQRHISALKTEIFGTENAQLQAIRHPNELKITIVPKAHVTNKQQQRTKIRKREESSTFLQTQKKRKISPTMQATSSNDTSQEIIKDIINHLNQFLSINNFTLPQDFYTYLYAAIDATDNNFVNYNLFMAMTNAGGPHQKYTVVEQYINNINSILEQRNNIRIKPNIQQTETTSPFDLATISNIETILNSPKTGYTTLPFVPDAPVLETVVDPNFNSHNSINNQQKTTQSTPQTSATYNQQIMQNQTIRPLPKAQKIETRDTALSNPPLRMQSNFFSSNSYYHNTSHTPILPISETQIQDFSALIKTINPPQEILNKINHVFQLITSRQLQQASLQLQKLIVSLPLYKKMLWPSKLGNINMILNNVCKLLAPAIKNNTQQPKTSMNSPNNTNIATTSTKKINLSDILNKLNHQGLPTNFLNHFNTALTCIQGNNFELARDIIDNIISLLKLENNLPSKKQNFFIKYFTNRKNQLSPLINAQQEKISANAAQVNTTPHCITQYPQPIDARNIILLKYQHIMTDTITVLNNTHALYKLKLPKMYGLKIQEAINLFYTGNFADAAEKLLNVNITILNAPYLHLMHQQYTCPHIQTMCDVSQSAAEEVIKLEQNHSQQALANNYSYRPLGGRF